MTPKPPWTEIVARIPVELRDAAVAWLLDRGAGGVQEDYPGLGDMGDDGPVVSGALEEWSQDAPRNTSPEVVVMAWLHAAGGAKTMRSAFEAFIVNANGGTTPEGMWIDTSIVEDRNWNEEWLSHWEPTPVGKGIVICPAGKEPAEPGGRTRIRITPGMAFGTGTHFTTMSCIEMAERLIGRRVNRPDEYVRPYRVLDVGTGSGILGICALAFGADSALGLDIDDDVVAEARSNAAMNGLEGRFEARNEPLGPDTGVFDLVFANLVAQVIVDLAGPLASATARDGTLILSGILNCHEATIVGAFKDLGMEVVETARDGTWVTLLLV